MFVFLRYINFIDFSPLQMSPAREFVAVGDAVLMSVPSKLPALIKLLVRCKEIKINKTTGLRLTAECKIQ